MFSIRVCHPYKSISINNLIVNCLDKWFPLRHITHVMPCITILLIKMDDMTNMKSKSNMKGQNENYET